MAGINLSTISLKNAQFTILDDAGALDYSTSIGQVVFTPSVSYTPHLGWDGFPVSYSITAVAWSMTLSYAQDLTTPQSLLYYLTANFGHRRAVAFTAQTDGATVTAEALLIPGQIGGLPGQPLSATVTLPLYGPPVIGGVA